MKKAFAFLLAMLLSIAAFAGAMPASAASVDTLAPLSVKTDTAPIGDYFEPCYDEPLEVFYTLYGDADMDDTVTIKDATLIQKAIAQLVTMEQEAMYLADVTGDLYITINDATAIQKYIAGVEAFFPVFTKYTIPEGSKKTTYSCSGSGYAEIEFTITEPDLYYIGYGFGSKAQLQAILCDENGYYITTGFSRSFAERFPFGSGPMFLKHLDCGTYKILIYTTGDAGYSDQEITISVAKDFLKIDKESAMPLLTGETFIHKSTSKDDIMKVYKIRNDTDTDDALIFKAVAEENLYVYIFSEDLECLGFFGEAEEKASVILDASHLKEDEYYYVLAYAGVDISITLSLDTMTHHLLKNSTHLEYNTPAVITTESYDYLNMQDYWGTGNYSNKVFDFTPAYNGYFKFSVATSFTTTTSDPLTMNLTVCDKRVLNYDENSILGTKTMVFEKSGTDYVTAYLEEGKTYYIYSPIIAPNALHSITVTVSACTQEEHLQSGSEPPKPIEIPEAEDIFVGDTKTLNISAEDGEIIYRFVPASADELIFYSEGNGDPWISIYDSYGNYIAYEDDIFYQEGKLNFALYGYVDAGETYYIGVACHDEAKTDIKFSIIKEKDYIYE
ncbi:MAG: dockerin type I repeat-containing protein [Ruminococcus sp.]|nr:dockerin type I repeat-containing protein [Ruminococcus sp.]